MDKSKKLNNREIKAEKIKGLVEKIGRSKVCAFADYHGLNANQIANLRSKVKEAGGELLIIKNTLLARALQVSSFQFPVSSLEGPSAVIFAYQDEITPFKATFEFVKTLGFPKFKFGFFGHDFLEKEMVENLAKIPSLDILQGKVVGALSSPIYGFVSVLQANIRNLVFALDKIAETKSINTKH